MMTGSQPVLPGEGEGEGESSILHMSMLAGPEASHSNNKQPDSIFRKTVGAGGTSLGTWTASARRSYSNLSSSMSGEPLLHRLKAEIMAMRATVAKTQRFEVQSRNKLLEKDDEIAKLQSQVTDLRNENDILRQANAKLTCDLARTKKAANSNLACHHNTKDSKVSPTPTQPAASRAPLQDLPEKTYTSNMVPQSRLPVRKTRTTSGSATSQPSGAENVPRLTVDVKKRAGTVVSTPQGGTHQRNRIPPSKIPVGRPPSSGSRFIR